MMSEVQAFQKDGNVLIKRNVSEPMKPIHRSLKPLTVRWTGFQICFLFFLETLHTFLPNATCLYSSVCLRLIRYKALCTNQETTVGFLLPSHPVWRSQPCFLSAGKQLLLKLTGFEFLDVKDCWQWQGVSSSRDICYTTPITISTVMWMSPPANQRIFCLIVSNKWPSMSDVFLRAPLNSASQHLRCPFDQRKWYQP